MHYGTSPQAPFFAIDHDRPPQMIFPKVLGGSWQTGNIPSGTDKASIWPIILGAVLVIFCFLLTVNNYLGNAKRTITSDGVGYYDHLPSIFLHHDFLRKDLDRQVHASIYERIDTLGVYVAYGDRLVNKYPVGVALLQAPFFLGTWWAMAETEVSNDGYETSFHRSIFHATLFYLLLTLIAFGALFREYNIPWPLIIFCQLLMVLATPVSHYANDQAGYSHVYSLFAISSFLFFFKKFSSRGALRYFVLTGVSLGLVLLLRPVNVLVLLFLPFVLGSWERTKELAFFLAKKWQWTLLGSLLVLAVLSIQCMVWYAQTGHLLLYSYQGEGFDLLRPHFQEVLFGYRKGLFIYTPVLLFALISMVVLGVAREWYLMLSWSMAFVLLTYVFSSWWSWYYGDSYGLRAYVEFLPLFFLPIAILLRSLRPGLKVITMAAMALSLPLNIIQNYQYKHYILHWSNMDHKRYWQVFLKTDDRYRGLLWKQNVQNDTVEVVGKVELGTIVLKDQELFNWTAVLDNTWSKGLSAIRIQCVNDFAEANNAAVELTIQDASTDLVLYRHTAPLIQFMENGFNVPQVGLRDFIFDRPLTIAPIKITVIVDPMGISQHLENVEVVLMTTR